MNTEKAARFLNRAGGFAAGIFGSKTAAISTMKNMAEGVTGKQAFMNGLKYNSASTAVPMTILGLAPKMVKEAGEGKGWMGYKLSGLGQTALAGAIGYSAVKDIVHSEGQKNLGQVNSRVQLPVSMMADYDGITQKHLTAADTGADGDLVFALNKLR